MIAIEYPDVELLLCGFLRPNLPSWAPLVDRKFPAPGWTAGFAVVVRDDSGTDRNMVAANRRVGLTVIGPGYQQTRQLAERVATLIRNSHEQTFGLPIADATVRGPYSLDAANRAEFYLTADLIVVGHSVTL